MPVPFKDVAVVVKEHPVVRPIKCVVFGLLKCLIPTFEDDDGPLTPSSVDVVTVICYFLRIID